MPLHQDAEHDNDHIAGAAKEAMGKITGDTKTRVEVAAEKTAGKVQSNAGDVKDTLRGTTKK
ncbi:CsbD family protein (plasmid) [Roseomonas marmotae]|uniref:CsbD family protein n=2 Tax=Roseomonas marmotae TaxID=2768161 RepID=A0ABS3KIG4_9PROT|nr:CsbD family protein [Roseomonas marmotae]MBO1077235.1 CsbD family protein [Roseomonas marmotae]QTI81223.1 CsbD family protein [Roseomonas marmotae]